MLTSWMLEEIAMDEKDILLVAGPTKSPLVCEFKLYNETQLLDIRKYYTDKKTGERMPTRKGISLTHVQYEILAEMFQDKAEEIEIRFSQDISGRAINTRSLEESRDATVDCFVELGSWKGAEMTRYEQKGGSSKLQLNKEHPWVSHLLYLTSQNTSDQLFDHITLLLKAYHQAHGFLDSRNTSAVEIVETIEANWGRTAKSLTKKAADDA